MQPSLQCDKSRVQCEVPIGVRASRQHHCGTRHWIQQAQVHPLQLDCVGSCTHETVARSTWYTGRLKKFGTIILYALTLPNINRFSKLFHYQNQEKICNNIVTKDPTTL